MLLLLLLGNCASDRYPIPKGNAENYWEHACGIQLPGFDGRHEHSYWRGAFPAIGDWYFYYVREHHGRHVYRVSHDTLIAHVPEVYSLLERGPEWPSAADRRDRQFIKKSERFAECSDMRIQAGEDYALFLEQVDAANGSPFRHMDGQEEIDSFLLQWGKARLYWVAVLFEAVFLWSWWMFTFHRGVFGRLNERLDVRIAFSPLLLLVPHYLGYAPYLLTFIPHGGILYPGFADVAYLVFGWVPNNAVDVWLFENLPKPLWPISPTLAAPMAASYSGSVSPTALLVFAGVVLAVVQLWRRLKFVRE